MLYIVDKYVTEYYMETLTGCDRRILSILQVSTIHRPYQSLVSQI